MPDDLASRFEDQTITLTSDDGQSFPCRILGVFKYGEKDYALLLHTTQPGSTAVMELIENEDGAVFRTIQDVKLFDEVLAFVKQELIEATGKDTEAT